MPQGDLMWGSHLKRTQSMGILHVVRRGELVAPGVMNKGGPLMNLKASDQESALRRGLWLAAWTFWLITSVAAPGPVVTARMVEVPAPHANAQRLASFLPTARPQGPNVAKDVEKKSNARENVRSRTRPSSTPGRRHSSMPLRNNLVPLDVTFTTDVAASQIFMHVPHGGGMQKLGNTDHNGRLHTRLTRGVYFITASRPGYQIVQQINVQPGRTKFTFQLRGRPLDGRRLAAGAAPVTTTITTPPTIAYDEAPGLTSEEILKRYLDPAQADSVTMNDWQLVQKQSAALFAQHPGDQQSRAQALFAQGQLAYLKGDYALAIGHFNQAALVMPNSALAFYGLGNAYLATNQTTEAMRAFQQAIQLEPSMVMPYKGMGDALNRLGKSKEALGYYRKAQGLGDHSPGVAVSLARHLIRSKRWAEALKELLKASEVRPTAELLVAIGDCYLEMKQPVSAAQAYRKATQLDARSSLAHAKYGEVLYELREHGDAFEALERALALDPAGGSIDRRRVRQLAEQAAAKTRIGGKK